MPREAAIQFALSGFNSPIERPTDFHIVKTPRGWFYRGADPRRPGPYVHREGRHLEMARDEDLASVRWHRLVTCRLEETERLSPGLGTLSGAFWDRRAERYAANATDTAADPFLRRLRRVIDSSSTVIDVGAGTGRFALPLAGGVKEVTAVDPSAGMLEVLRRDGRRLGARNVTTVRGSWEEASVAVADVVFSAFVLPLVPDARRFLDKLDDAARQHAFLYLGGYCGDAVLDPLWRHFHGAPRAPGPSYLDALAVLRELGIEPEVKVVELVNRRRFATVEEAVEHYRDALLLADIPDVRRELEGLLAIWLLGRRGALRSPLRATPAAIIHWRPRHTPGHSSREKPRHRAL